MDALAGPVGFEPIDVPHILLLRAVDAFNLWLGAHDQVGFVLRNHRGRGVGNPNIGAEVQEYVARENRAQGERDAARAAIAQAAGIDDVQDLVLIPQFDRRRMVAYEAFRRIRAPPAADRDEPLMPVVRMAMPNSIAETPSTLLSIEGQSSSSASQGLSGGQIAGITVGTVAGASLIVAAIIFWRRRRTSRKPSCQAEPRLV